MNSRLRHDIEELQTQKEQISASENDLLSLQKDVARYVHLNVYC